MRPLRVVALFGTALSVFAALVRPACAWDVIPAVSSWDPYNGSPSLSGVNALVQVPTEDWPVQWDTAAKVVVPTGPDYIVSGLGYSYSGFSAGFVEWSIVADVDGLPGTTDLWSVEMPVYGDYFPNFVHHDPEVAHGPGARLHAGNSYWIVAEAVADASIGWDMIHGADEPIARRCSDVPGGWYLDGFIPQNGSLAFTLYGDPLPEPSTIALLVTGGISLLVCAWRRRKRDL